MTGYPTYPIWGWANDAAEQPRPAELAALVPVVQQQLRTRVSEPETPAPLAELPPDRVGPRLPESLAASACAAPADRARHSLGRSYRDVVRGIRGTLPHVCDTVLRPVDEAAAAAVLDWCTDNDVAVVPFGGGTSVVGGVEPRVPDGYTGVVSLDLCGITGITDVDVASRAARALGGTPGPDLEAQLRPHGLTARFYPQSFERSTVGGWLATRAAGHFATGPTHVDDLVQSIRAVTPAGTWESQRVPASGAGPSPDRMLLGSEGSLGVITSAWLRVQPRPTSRWSATLAGPDFAATTHAARALVQAGFRPATLRAIDAAEAAVTGTLSTGEAVLVLGVESWADPAEAAAAQLLAHCRDLGLRLVEAGGREGPASAWRSSFLRAPYLREQLVLLGLLVETFETAVTWDRLDGLVAEVTAVTTAALRAVCGEGSVTCRLTHVYPDGAAPYFTVIAPARRGSELAQWAEVKAAAAEALVTAGGTITHHHAVGRDHAPWYAGQRPAPFADALAAAKRAVDPGLVLNPGTGVASATGW